LKTSEAALMQIDTSSLRGSAGEEVGVGVKVQCHTRPKIDLEVRRRHHGSSIFY